MSTISAYGSDKFSSCICICYKKTLKYPQYFVSFVPRESKIIKSKWVFLSFTFQFAINLKNNNKKSVEDAALQSLMFVLLSIFGSSSATYLHCGLLQVFDVSLSCALNTVFVQYFERWKLVK